MNSRSARLGVFVVVGVALLLTACVGEIDGPPTVPQAEAEKGVESAPGSTLSGPERTGTGEVDAPSSDEADDQVVMVREPPGLHDLTCEAMRTAFGAALPLDGFDGQEMIAELGGDSYRAGCSFESATWRLAVEVHVATPEQHSLVWGLATPSTQFARDEERIDGVGDEAYAGADGTSVAARKGFVEVLLYHRSQDENVVTAPFTLDQLLAATASLLEPWPSGPGAAPPSPKGVPVDLLPPDVAPADVNHFDPNDPVYEGVYDDSPEVHEIYSFGEARGRAEDYCDSLRSLDYVDESLDSEEAVVFACVVSNRQWRIRVAGLDATFSAFISPS